MHFCCLIVRYTFSVDFPSSKQTKKSNLSLWNRTKSPERRFSFLLLYIFWLSSEFSVAFRKISAVMLKYGEHFPFEWNLAEWLFPQLVHLFFIMSTGNHKSTDESSKYIKNRKSVISIGVISLLTTRTYHCHLRGSLRKMGINVPGKYCCQFEKSKPFSKSMLIGVVLEKNSYYHICHSQLGNASFWSAARKTAHWIWLEAIETSQGERLLILY